MDIDDVFFSEHAASGKDPDPYLTIISGTVKRQEIPAPGFNPHHQQQPVVHKTDADATAVPQHDAVNHPSHYCSHPSGIECIEITKHHDFCIGNAIKYLWRSGLKHEQGMDDAAKQIEDLKKAIFYINQKIRMLEGDR